MSVPLTLLGVSERGPSHGYDLRRDYDAFFGRGQAAALQPGICDPVRLARDGKAVLALMLGRQAGDYLDIQRAAHLRRMRELTELKRTPISSACYSPTTRFYRLEADSRWIDHSAARLDLLSRAVRR